MHPQTDPNQPPYSIGEWLYANNIYGGYGFDSDSRVITTYQENGQPSVSTTIYNNEVQCIGYNQIYLHQPGVYTVSWTYMDINNIPNFVDNPDTTRSITLVVFQVEVSQPTTWPKPVALGNTFPLTATVTPSEALGGTYTWAKDSGDGSGSFAPNNTSVNTTLFTADSIGDVFIRVAYTKEGETVYSEPRRIIVFGIQLEELKFTSDHGVLYDNDSSWGDEGTLYPEPEWIRNTQNVPMTHTKNQNISMTGKFSIAPSLPVSATVYLQADDNEEDNLDALKMANVSGMTTEISGITTATTLQNKIYIAVVDYQWKYSTDSTHWASANSSGPHKYYVTFGAPIGGATNKCTEQRIKWDIETCSQQTTEQGIADAIYTAFESEPPYFRLGANPPNPLWLLMEGPQYEGE
ncbi:MAG: hypothetical protein QME64_05170, partial [bacterium]|nr:hypothetical protein [bacterium]